ncbi:MAG: hypothetical protein SFU86_02815 [Pirellulaceae bacterium]|nr:hypothetical protein [Pirellulaceae bacterium]
MRAAVMGFVGALLLLAVWAVGFPEASAQRPAGQAHAGSAELITLSFDAGEGRQQLTVVDPRTRVLAVYHVDRATGALALKSVRNVHWDLQIEDYNSANPTPREIRLLTDSR